MNLPTSGRVVGVGADIVEVERVARALQRKGFAERCFTAGERRYCLSKRNPEQHFAARFAAKEALAKALGVAVSRQEVEVKNEGRGRPALLLRGRARELAGEREVAVSLSHCGCHALAVVVVWRGGGR